MQCFWVLVFKNRTEIISKHNLMGIIFWGCTSIMCVCVNTDLNDGTKTLCVMVDEMECDRML